jgi:hypothetical protein
LLSEQYTSFAVAAAFNPTVPIPLYSSLTVLLGGMWESTVGMILASNSFRLAYLITDMDKSELGISLSPSNISNLSEYLRLEEKRHIANLFSQ